MAMAESVRIEGVTNKGVIGKGAFGVVHLVENKAGEEFAVKVMEWREVGQRQKEVIQNELDVLQQLDHPHIVLYVNAFLDEGLVYVITEFCQGGDIGGFLDNLKSHDVPAVPEDLLVAWLKQIARALEHMHTTKPDRILHRDLKPTNIFVTEAGDIRVGDMGIARMLDSPDAMAVTFCGTLSYMSPEALYETPYNEKTDIWGLGCCVVEMATLERAYEGSTIYILRNAVLQKRRPLPGDQFSKGLDDLLSSMLSLRYEERPSATELLQHPVVGRCNTRPTELLTHHRLSDKLGRFGSSRAPSSQSTATTISTLRSHPPPSYSSTASSTTSAITIHTLNLDDSQHIEVYRRKVDGRTRGSTSGRYEDQIIKRKSVKKKPVTVLQRKDDSSESHARGISQGKDSRITLQRSGDSLGARPLLTNLSAMLSRRSGGPMATDKTAPHVPDEAPFASQVDSFRNLLVQMIGQESFDVAQAIIQSARSGKELLDNLVPHLGDLQISNFVVYYVLLESSWTLR